MKKMWLLLCVILVLGLMTLGCEYNKAEIKKMIAAAQEENNKKAESQENKNFDDKGNSAEDFLIKYKSVSGQLNGGDVEIIINVNGDYTYTDTFQPLEQEERKTEPEVIKGKLTESELNSLKKYIIDSNDFFGLPADLSKDPTKLADAGYNEIEVKIGEKIHKAGGYGAGVDCDTIADKRFARIADRLYEYKNKFSKK